MLRSTHLAMITWISRKTREHMLTFLYLLHQKVNEIHEKKLYFKKWNWKIILIMVSFPIDTWYCLREKDFQKLWQVKDKQGLLQSHKFLCGSILLHLLYHWVILGPFQLVLSSYHIQNCLYFNSYSCGNTHNMFFFLLCHCAHFKLLSLFLVYSS
jgi:hypothetical protein